MAEEQIIFTEKVRHPSTNNWIDMREVYEDPNSTKHINTTTTTSVAIGATQSDAWKNYSDSVNSLVWPNDIFQYIDNTYNANNPKIKINTISFSNSEANDRLNDVQYNYLGATVTVASNEIEALYSNDTVAAEGIFKYKLNVPTSVTASTGATASNPLHILPNTIENYNNNIDIFSSNDIGLYGQIGDTNIHGFNFVEKINNQSVSYYEQNEHSVINVIEEPVVFWDNQHFTLESIIQYSWEQIDLNDLSQDQENFIIINDKYEAYYDTDLRDQLTNAIRLTYNDYFNKNKNESPSNYMTFNGQNIPYFIIYPFDDPTSLIDVFINPNDGLIYLKDQINVHPNAYTYYLDSSYNYFYHYQNDFVEGRFLTEESLKPLGTLLPNYSFNYMRISSVDNIKLNQFGITNLNNPPIDIAINDEDYCFFNIVPIQPAQLAGKVVINKDTGNYYFKTSIGSLIHLSNFYASSTPWFWHGTITVNLYNAKEIYTENVNGWYVSAFNLETQPSLLPENEINILNKYNINIQDNIFKYKNIETEGIIKYSYSDDRNIETAKNLEIYLDKNEPFDWNYSATDQDINRDKLWILNNTPLIWETTEETPKYFIKETDFNFNKQFINFIKKVYGRYTINYNFDLTYGFDQYTFFPEQKIRYYSGDNRASGEEKLLNVGSSSVPVYIENGEFKPLNNFNINDNIDFELLDGSEDNQNNIDTYGEFDDYD